MATSSSAAPGAPPGTPLQERDRETLSPLKAGPGPGATPPRIDTHRPSASSCPHRHPDWERRNRARTQTWWHLPRVEEQWAIRELAGQGSEGCMEVFLSSHAHTTYRPQEPATTARDMHWHKPDHPGLGPRAPQGTQHLCLLPATPQRKPVLTPEPTAQPAWLGLAPRMAEGKGDSQVGWVGGMGI